MKKLISPLLLLLASWGIQAQTIQFLFCGKTGTVSPTLDGSGNDQREKASIHLDFLKIGIIGSSKTNPVFVLGDTGPNNVSFATKVLADKCENNTDQAYCTQCQTCATVTSSTNGALGRLSGKMQGNVRAETKNNNLVIMSTNVNNVVCYETQKIPIPTLSGKKAEITVKYEGRSQGWPVHNISLNYRYNDNAYFSTPFFFNKNSGNVGVFEETYVIVQNVPVFVEDLSKKLSFELNPNPVQNEIYLKLEAFEGFQANFTILDESGRQHSTLKQDLQTGGSTKTLEVGNLPAGFYILKISDNEGRVSSKKFTKI
jgi:hypothetical protein